MRLAAQFAASAQHRRRLCVYAEDRIKADNMRSLEVWVSSGCVGDPPSLTECDTTGAESRQVRAEVDAWQALLEKLRATLALARDQVAGADRRLYKAARNVAIAEMLLLAEEAERCEARALELREQILAIDFAFSGEFRHEESEPLPKAVTRVLEPFAADHARILAAVEIWGPRLTHLLQGCEV